MTKAVVSLGPVCRLRAEGHATGSPQVCAGVSAIVCALEGYLEAEGLEHERDVAPGEASLFARWSREVEAAFTLAAIGLLRIAKGYPSFLQVDFQENKKFVPTDTEIIG